jgi:hypothetical protein
MGGTENVLRGIRQFGPLNRSSTSASARSRVRATGSMIASSARARSTQPASCARSRRLATRCFVIDDHAPRMVGDEDWHLRGVLPNRLCNGATARLAALGKAKCALEFTVAPAPSRALGVSRISSAGQMRCRSARSRGRVSVGLRSGRLGNERPPRRTAPGRRNWRTVQRHGSGVIVADNLAALGRSGSRSLRANRSSGASAARYSGSFSSRVAGTERAVVRFVLGVDDALHGRAGRIGVETLTRS